MRSASGPLDLMRILTRLCTICTNSAMVVLHVAHLMARRAPWERTSLACRATNSSAVTDRSPGRSTRRVLALAVRFASTLLVSMSATFLASSSSLANPCMRRGQLLVCGVQGGWCFQDQPCRPQPCLSRRVQAEVMAVLACCLRLGAAQSEQLQPAGMVLQPTAQPGRAPIGSGEDSGGMTSCTTAELAAACASACPSGSPLKGAKGGEAGVRGRQTCMKMAGKLAWCRLWRVAVNVEGHPGQHKGSRLELGIQVLQVRLEQRLGRRWDAGHHPLVLLQRHCS